jgi:hypothetical protein
MIKSILPQISNKIKTGRAWWEPEFTLYPWPGIVRVLFWSYVLDLPSLRGLVIEVIAKTARGGER